MGATLADRKSRERNSISEKFNAGQSNYRGEAKAQEGVSSEIRALTPFFVSIPDRSAVAACQVKQFKGAKKMETKIISPRINPAIEKWLAETFRSKTGGAEYAIEAFHALYRRSLHALKGRFSSGELKLMIDVFNGSALTAGIAGQQCLISCIDGMALDALDEKWSVDRQAFTGKLQALTLIEATCLEIWANGFWYGDAEKEKDIFIYIKGLE